MLILNALFFPIELLVIEKYNDVPIPELTTTSSGIVEASQSHLIVTKPTSALAGDDGEITTADSTKDKLINAHNMPEGVDKMVAFEGNNKSILPP